MHSQRAHACQRATKSLTCHTAHLTTRHRHKLTNRSVSPVRIPPTAKAAGPLGGHADGLPTGPQSAQHRAFDLVDIPGDGGSSACRPVFELLSCGHTVRGRLQLRAGALLPQHLFRVWHLPGRGTPGRHVGQVLRPNVAVAPAQPRIHNAQRHRKTFADRSTRHHNTALPGEYVARPDARTARAHIESTLTDYHAGVEIDVTDLVGKALSWPG